MLQRGFLKKANIKAEEQISGNGISFGKRYHRDTLPAGVKIPVCSGIALIIVSLVLILKFFYVPFVGFFTIGASAGVVSIFLGLMLNRAFTHKKA